MTAYPAQMSQPVAWIYGSVYTGVPGYRLVQVGASTYTVSTVGAQPKDFWTLLGLVDSALAPATWDLVVSGSDWTLTGAAAAVVTWADRLGALLGFDAEPGDAEPSAASLTPRAVSPACIPLQSIGRELVTREQQRTLVVDRFGRGHGSVFGDAEVWRFAVKMDRAAFLALRNGWSVSGGPVTISGFTLAEHIAATAVAFSSTESGGYHRGRIIGVESGTWPDLSAGRTLYETTILLAAEPP